MTLQATNLTPITGPLSALRRTVRAWILADYLWRLGALLVVFVLVSATLDLMFRFDPAQRGIILGLAILEACRLTWIKFLVPITRRLREEELLRRVERRHPETGESLLSALQFARMPDPGALGVSTAMIREAIRHGLGAAGQVDFKDVLDRQRLRRNTVRAMLAFIVLGAILGSAAVAYPQEFGTWFNRMVLIGNEQWPRQTTLELVDEASRLGVMPRGDDWVPRAAASGRIPDIVEIDFRPEGQRGYSTELMRRLGDSSFTFTFRNIREPFEFRLRGGDHRTDWMAMRLVERPACEQLDVRIIPPAYQRDRSPDDTRREPWVVPAGRTAEYVYPGSTVEIDALANKPLRHASIRRDGEVVALLDISPDEAGRPRAIRGRIEPEQFAGGVHEVFLIDSDGLPTRRPDRFTLNLRKDEPPQVNSELAGISTMVVPEATIPIDSRITDDFAVERVAVSYEVATPRRSGDDYQVERDRIGGDEQDQPQVIDLGQQPQMQQAEVEAENIIEMDTLADQFGASRIEGRYRLELMGLDLSVGQTLAFTVDAWDNDDVSGPNRGRSSPFVLRVVDRETLTQALMRREQEQRREVMRLLEDHKRIQTRMLAVEADVSQRLGQEPPDDEPVRTDDRGEIAVAEQTQRLAPTRALGIAEQFAQIMLEHENNRLDEEGGSGALRLRRQIERQVVGALIELAHGEMAEAADALDDAMRATDPQEVLSAVSRAAAIQQQVIEQLEAVIEVMGTWETYRQIVTEYRARLREQRELREAVRREMEAEVEQLFD